MLWLMGEKTFLISQLTVVWEHVNVRKIATCEAEDYATSCLLDYNYFNKHCKMIAIDLSK